MIEYLFQLIALVAYLFCAFRIVCFSRITFHKGYAWFATILIASFLGQSIHILFYKDPVTIWDSIFAIVLAVLIYKTKGNVAKLIWSAA